MLQALTPVPCPLTSPPALELLFSSHQLSVSAFLPHSPAPPKALPIQLPRWLHQDLQLTFPGSVLLGPAGRRAPRAAAPPPPLLHLHQEEGRSRPGACRRRSAFTATLRNLESRGHGGERGG